MNLSEIIERIKQVKGLREDHQVASLLGFNKSALSERKRRNSIPRDKLELLCEQENINLDWLLTGEGSPHRPKEIEFEVYNLVPQSEDGEATYRTSWGFLTKSDIEKTLKIPLGSLDEWMDKQHRDVMIVKEPKVPYEAKIKDQKLLNLIQKLEHIYKEGNFDIRAKVRGIIEEAYDEIVKSKDTQKKEMIEQKKVG